MKRPLVSACLLVACLPVFADDIPLKTDTRLLLNFESEADITHLRLNSTIATRVTTGVSEGTHALHVLFEPNHAYPSINFTQSAPADFRGYGGIAFDLYNPTDETVAFGVRIDSSHKADGNGNHSRAGKGSIDGRQGVTFVIPFGANPADLGMKSLPGYGAFRDTGAGGRGPFDLGHIVTWQIFLNRPLSPAEVIVDNVRLVPGRKQDFNGIIDRFGQFTREEWPGKIHADADFAEQLAAEAKDLAARPAVAEPNKFGGWSAGPQLKATGFFRVEKHDGKWAFVDPEGRLFLSFGPTTIGAGSTTMYSGREYMFTEPPAPAFVAGGEGKVTYDFFAANLERKYGKDYKRAWFDRTYERLVSWGFNTIGGFSGWETLKNGKVPYTATVWVGGNHARIRTGGEQVRSMHDPFDPQFAEDVVLAARAQASRIKDDPWFLGYFVGNEEHWGYFRAGPRSHYTLVLTALKSSAAASPAKRAFVAQLREAYGDVAKLNAAWGTGFADWVTLDAPITIKEPYPPAQLADFSKLLTSFSEQYFRVVQAGLKQVSPNHLYLGCRFAGYSPEVLAGAAKYSDVLSFNLYRLTLDAKEMSILDPYDKPVVVGEFHFGAPDRGVFDTGLFGVADQAARGRAYQNYVRSVLALPKFVGAHWFQYTDQPATGRPMDGENGNVGFVSITDTPHRELIEAAREIHAEMYQLRFGKDAR